MSQNPLWKRAVCPSLSARYAALTPTRVVALPTDALMIARISCRMDGRQYLTTLASALAMNLRDERRLTGQEPDVAEPFAASSLSRGQIDSGLPAEYSARLFGRDPCFQITEQSVDEDRRSDSRRGCRCWGEARALPRILHTSKEARRGTLHDRPGGREAGIRPDHAPQFIILHDGSGDVA